MTESPVMIVHCWCSNVNETSVPVIVRCMEHTDSRWDILYTCNANTLYKSKTGLFNWNEAGFKQEHFLKQRSRIWKSSTCIITQCNILHRLPKVFNHPSKSLDSGVESLVWPQMYKIKHLSMMIVPTNICERMDRSQELSEFMSCFVIRCHQQHKSSRKTSLLQNISVNC